VVNGTLSVRFAVLGPRTKDYSRASIVSTGKNAPPRVALPSAPAGSEEALDATLPAAVVARENDCRCSRVMTGAADRWHRFAWMETQRWRYSRECAIDVYTPLTYIFRWN